MKPKIETIKAILPRVRIDKGIREVSRHLFSERLCFGDHPQFGWTTENSKISVSIKEVTPKIKNIGQI